MTNNNPTIGGVGTIPGWQLPVGVSDTLAPWNGSTGISMQQLQNDRNAYLTNGEAVTPGQAAQVRAAYLAASPSTQQAFAAQLAPATTGGALGNGVGTQQGNLDNYINAAMGNPNKGPGGLWGPLEAVGFGLAPLGFAAASAAAAGGAAGADIAGSSGSDILAGSGTGDQLVSAGENLSSLGSNAFGPSATGYGSGVGTLGTDFSSAGTLGPASSVGDLSGPAGDYMGLGGGAAVAPAASSPLISPSSLAQGLKGLGGVGGSDGGAQAPAQAPIMQAAPAHQVMGPTQQQPGQLQPYAGAPAYQSYNQPSSTQQMMAAALNQNVQNNQRPAPVGIGFGLNQNPQTYGLA